jgi:DNA repair protein RecO (recombination protein O)
MPPPARRITDEPAFVLHSYPWSESSLILEVFTRHWGRAVLVAKGAKKPSSNFRPVLLPLQPLLLTYTVPSQDGAARSADIHPLKAAQWQGGHVMPTGEALWAGLYLNELLMRLLARDDPHRALFDLYAGVVRVLAAPQHSPTLEFEPALRTFEILLLRELGLLPHLDRQTLTQRPLQPSAHYALVPEVGLHKTEQTMSALTGAQWQELQQALDAAPSADDASHAFRAVLRCAAAWGTPLKPQLRTLLQHHCGTMVLHTRKFLVELHTIL